MSKASKVQKQEEAVQGAKEAQLGNDQEDDQEEDEVEDDFDQDFEAEEREEEQDLEQNEGVGASKPA